jgi:hypothetical protein
MKIKKHMIRRNNMMTGLALRFTIIAGVLLLLTITTVLTVGTLNSAQVHAQDNCTLNTLKGTYLFEARGVITDTGQIHPYAEAGSLTLDGNGQAQGVISLSTDGLAVARREVFSATYEHETGCVFSVVDAFGLEFDLYTTPSGTRVTYFSPGFSGTMFK